MVIASLIVASLAFLQTMAFAMVSRARNRDHMGYHAVASVLSNGIFFLTFHQLVIADMDYKLAIPYIAGTVLGSLYGARLSMKIEKWLGAKT